MRRISSIDITRGIVMMIMALDHTRDLLHINSVARSPTDLSIQGRSTGMLLIQLQIT